MYSLQVAAAAPAAPPPAHKVHEEALRLVGIRSDQIDHLLQGHLDPKLLPLGDLDPLPHCTGPSKLSASPKLTSCSNPTNCSPSCPDRLGWRTGSSSDDDDDGGGAALRSAFAPDVDAAAGVASPVACGLRFQRLASWAWSAFWVRPGKWGAILGQSGWP